MQTTQTTGARLHAVLGLLFVSSAMVLFLPFFPPGLQWLFALLFWAPLVAAESARAAPPAKAAEARCAESGAESGRTHGGCPATGSGDHAGGAHVYAHLNGVF